MLEERAKLPADPRWTAYLADLPRSDEKPLQPGGAAERRGAYPRASTRGAHQRLPAAPARLRVVTVTLPLGDLTSRQMRAARRRRAPVRRRHDAHDRRAEHRASLGERGRSARALRRAATRSAWPHPARRRSSTSPPARAPTPASSASRRRAGWPASCATAWWPRASSSTRRCRDCTSRSAAASTPAASTTSPTSASTASAATSAATRCRTSRSCSAASGTTTPAAYGLAIGAVPSKNIPARGRSPHRALRARTPRRRDVPAVLPAHRQEGAQGDARRVHQGAGARRGRRATTPTGAIRASTPSATWAWASAPARSSRWSSSAWPTPSARCSRRSCCWREGDFAAGRSARLSRHAAGGQGAGAHASFPTSATTPTRIVQEFKTRFVDTEQVRRASSPAASSRSICFARHERSAGRRRRPESAHQLIEEATLFVDAGHACQARFAQQKEAAVAPASQVISLESLA